jgi:hypothetical protein
MSKYWNKMEILRQGKQFLKSQENKINELFISQERPAFFVNKDYYNVKTSSTYNYSDKELEEISQFYCRNYRIGKSNNTIYVSNGDLKRYLNVLSEILIIKIDNSLIGSIISFNIPVVINTDLNAIFSIKSSERFEFFKSKDSLIFGCSSFLILDGKYRGKGLGMALIQESLQILYEYGGLGAYFINTVSRCDNSIPLFSWYYPLNLEKLDSCNYNYPKEYRSYFNLPDKDEKEVERVIVKNSKEAYEFYFNYMKGKKFYFAPSYEYWLKWIESFPTYIVRAHSGITGMYSFNSNNIRYPLFRCEIMTGILLTCIGEQPSTLKSSLITAKKMFDMLTIYETGDLTKNIFRGVFAQNSHKSYINFFNTRLKLEAGDFYSPLF